ncbi:MAG: quinone-interacting membrane-bound oxidoreductase complex subunit QmoC [Deltaproteobacteria bacterium]|nr:quinone-interacting membrane-bound oxidoreductase complex subunit QmoC [Deltaproteobacteria bacterium]
MGDKTELITSSEFQQELRKRGGLSVSRCFQCATCSSVCQLAPAEAPFPRRQMLWAQWGLTERLMTDPGVWLCHQCNDCNTRCPRDAKPGDVMQTIRSLAIERLAVPGFMGRLVGRAATTWPLLIGIPFLFWIVALYAVNGLEPPASPLVYDHFVPHWLIYIVYFTTTGLVSLATLASGLRFWNMLGKGAQRSGSFISSLIGVLIEIAVHKRFAKCETNASRRLGHFMLLWGFVGAALASGLIIVALYIMHEEMPLAFLHPFKIVGNIAAVLLVAGGVAVLLNRLQPDQRAGAPTAYDNFFLSVVLLVIASGVLTELGRYFLDPLIACWIYIIHLSAVLSLFATFPYSKFAHMLYRTLAMVHERMTTSQNK